MVERRDVTVTFTRHAPSPQAALGCQAAPNDSFCSESCFEKRPELEARSFLLLTERLVCASNTEPNVASACLQLLEEFLPYTFNLLLPVVTLER